MQPDQDDNGGRNFEAKMATRAIRKRLMRFEKASLKHAHTFIIKRLDNVQEVRRHVGAWLLLMGVLIASVVAQTLLTASLYQREAAAEGANYAEGVAGKLDTLNPIFATSAPEKAASELLFAALAGYDRSGTLRPELAESWQITNDGKTYTVTLKPNLKWSDGAPLSARDVAYTYRTIADRNANSPLYLTWANISVRELNERMVEFTLPAPFSPFPHLLTTGILPAHILQSSSLADLRASEFNRNPITSGPFIFASLQSAQGGVGRSVLRVSANARYHGGKPSLERFQLYVYNNEESLARAYRTNEINAAADVNVTQAEQLKDLKNTVIISAPINNVTLAMLKNDSPVLADINIRRALLLGTDRTKIVSQTLFGRVGQVSGPIPTSLLANQPVATQAPFNRDEANRLLDAAGWVRGTDGVRTKDGQPLRLDIVAGKGGDYPLVLQELSRQWSELGVTVNTTLVEDKDIQQNVVSPRVYDVILYELTVGGDPDVYAYWHSSQATSRGLNLANYRSGKADDALDSARARSEPDLRSAKYKTFVDQWVADVPAIALYQPTMIYVQKDSVTSFDNRFQFTDPVDRYSSVQYWASTRQLMSNTP